MNTKHIAVNKFSAGEIFSPADSVALLEYRQQISTALKNAIEALTSSPRSLELGLEHLRKIKIALNRLEPLLQRIAQTAQIYSQVQTANTLMKAADLIPETINGLHTIERNYFHSLEQHRSAQQPGMDKTPKENLRAVFKLVFAPLRNTHQGIPYEEFELCTRLNQELDTNDQFWQNWQIIYNAIREFTSSVKSG